MSVPANCFSRIDHTHVASIQAGDNHLWKCPTSCLSKLTIVVVLKSLSADANILITHRSSFIVYFSFVISDTILLFPCLLISDRSMVQCQFSHPLKPTGYLMIQFNSDPTWSQCRPTGQGLSLIRLPVLQTPVLRLPTLLPSWRQIWGFPWPPSGLIIC